MKKKKKTLGQHVYENLKKSPDYVEVFELQREMTKDWPELIAKQQAIDKEYCKKHGFKQSFLVILLRKHKHLPMTLDQKFISRLTEPQMHPECTAYKFNHEDESIELLWSLPPYEVIEEMWQNPQNYDHQKELLSYVWRYKTEIFNRIDVIPKSTQKSAGDK